MTAASTRKRPPAAHFATGVGAPTVETEPLLYRVTKRVIDVTVAGALLVVLAPLLALVVVAIRLTSSGPAVFRQERVGRDGELFTCLKFRTMHIETDDEIHRRYVQELLHGSTSPDGGRPGVFKLVDDPRITRVGGPLRRASIDELPQLVNVLRGDMSLVGPRPMLAWEAALLDPWAQERFAVKPGLTGLWQVSGRSLVSVREALVLDVEYVRGRSLWLDLVILARTPAAVLRTGTAA
jgi:lipopolysaccharide/colanic/teichoic acid biosynthesis glycosyltransferase